MISTHSLLHWTCLVLLCSSNAFSHALYISKNENGGLPSAPELSKRSSHFHSTHPEDPRLPDPDDANKSIRGANLRARTPEPRLSDPEAKPNSKRHQNLKKSQETPRYAVKRNSNSTLPFKKFPGTNKNVPSQDKIGFSFIGDTPSIRTTSNIRSEPFAIDVDCKPGVLPYESCVGGELGFKTKGTFLPLDRTLQSKYVQQGEIGDCGLGAAMKSLILCGYEYNIRQKFTHPGKFPNSPGYEDIMIFMASFYREDGSKVVTIIDDGLPKPCDADYHGFRPTISEVFFFPLLEKAFAKFVDEYPEQYRWGGYSETWGYAGLESISGGKAIRAIIGGTAKYAVRPNLQARSGNLQVDFIKRFKFCMEKNIPCVTGTPEFRKLSMDGKTTVELHLNGFPSERAPMDPSNVILGGMKAKVVSGWTIENIPFVPVDRPGILIRLYNPAADKEYILVVAHAYAVSRSHQGDDYVMVSNPWNCHPTADAMGCDGNGEYHLPVLVAAAVFAQIDWVE